MQLTELWSFIRSELLRANADRRHAFRTFVLATNSDFPVQRTLVKRKTLEDLSTLAYTDSRTSKVKQLDNDPRCSLLFYDAKKKVQISITAKAEIIKSGDLFEQHQTIALVNPKDYSTTLPPGTELSEDVYRIDAQTYFCLLKFQALSIQILKLGKEQHLRAIFNFENEWKGSWLVP